MSKIIEQIEAEQLKTDIPDFAPGDTVKVRVKVKEGNRERLQAYEGVVLAKKQRGLNSSFTVRKVTGGEGVERVFQTHSPLLEGIEVVRRGDVRRAKLYYLRERAGKSARIKEKIQRDKTQKDKTQADKTQADKTQADKTQADKTQADKTQAEKTPR